MTILPPAGPFGKPCFLVARAGGLGQSALAMRLWLIALLLLVPVAASGTVNNSTRSVSYTGDGGSTFTVPFQFDLATDLVVTKTLIATDTPTTLVQGADYTVRLPVGSVNGSITTQVPVESTHTIRIDRNTKLTQPRQFRRQGFYRAADHEAAFDRLTMMVQEATLEAGSSGDTAVAAHVGELDPHVQYFLLAGRTAGQVGYGSTSSQGTLTLHSTSHLSKGKILLGSGSAFDDAQERLGLGTTSPAYTLDLDDGNLKFGSHWVLDDTGIWALNTAQRFEIGTGDTGSLGTASGPAGIMLYGPDHVGLARRFHTFADQYVFFDESGTTMMSLTDSALTVASADVSLTSGKLIAPDVDGNGSAINVSSGASETGTVTIGGTITVDESNDRVGIGDATPSYPLDVNGNARFTGQVAERRRVVSLTASASLDLSTDCNALVTVDPASNTIVTIPTAGASHTGCEITIIAIDGGNDVTVAFTSGSISGWCTDHYPSVPLISSNIAVNAASSVALVSNGEDTVHVPTLTMVATGTSHWSMTDCRRAFAPAP